MSCRWHGYSWPSLATFPYRSSPQAGLQGYIPYPHRAAVCMFWLVVQHLLGHMWGSICQCFWRNLWGVMTEVLVCSLEVREFKLHSRCYAHLRANTLRKSINSLIPTGYSLNSIITVLKGCLGIKYPIKFDISVNKKRKLIKYNYFPKHSW